MDNKPWYEKIYIWIGIVAGVFAILGISIFGGKSLLENKDANDSTANFEGNDINTGNQSPVINGNNDKDSDLSSKSNSLPLSEIDTQETSENNTEERYHKGTITKTGWESKFIGLRYTNPEEMSMSTEEELDKMNELEWGTPSIVFDQNELGKARLTTVFEMTSQSDNQSIIVGVCVERLIDETDISQFIESFESQMNRNPFYNYTLISDDETAKIGSGDYIMVSYMVEFNNVFRYQDNYFRLVGDRVIMISLNFNDERARDNVLHAFTAY